MKKILLAVILILPTIVNAQAETQTEKVERLMKALGMVEMWQQQIVMGEKQGQEIGKQGLDQILAGLDPDAEFRKRFEDAFNTYLTKLRPPWAAQDIVDKWASIFGPHFSPEELDQLIAFYTSELGRKDVSVTKTSMIEFSNYYQEQWKPLMESAVAELIADLKIVAKECKCVRREP